MSYPEDGRDMEPQQIQGGSVRRAREMAMAGLAGRTQGESRLPIRVPMGNPNPQLPLPLPLPIARPSPAPIAQPVTTSPPRAGIPRPRGDAPITGDDISRPTQIPQWPLGGPPIIPSAAAAANPGLANYQPPPGRSQPPQRPPRPSRGISMLDGSQVQELTPVFQYQPTSNRESEVSIGQSITSSSRPSTTDSVGSIPDFPLPLTTPIAPPRRSVNLGPPPSARRGASSFYSNASFVSPIPEESPRSRSHASYASSAAIPRDRDSWDSSISPGPSPNYPDARFEDAIPEEGREIYGEDQGDESQLVRSASVGKRGKALLVTTSGAQRSSQIPEMGIRPIPSPVQPGPFNDGTGYVDQSSTSSGSIQKSQGLHPPPAMAAAGAAGVALTAESILNAYGAASASDPSNPSRRLSISPSPIREYSNLSAIRRPPRLDIDAVKAAESRGSLTSLPDLIRRATRLAASLEKGRRPASRFVDDMDQYPGYSAQSEKNRASDYEKHQSGLSDMLAAFPPPAQAMYQPRRSWRQSLRDNVGSWPLPARLSGMARNRDNSPLSQQQALPTYNIPNSANDSMSNLNGNNNGNLNNKRGEQKQGRRCCGLPLWGFIILVIVLLIIVTAAVVIPVEFFVVRRGNNRDSSAQPLTDCQNMLQCANGGTNVVTAQGTCSCICTGGFTGATCTIPGSNGCTTTNVVDQSPNVGNNVINNVTLGDSLPRLIQAAAETFSVPLSVTQILAKFNAGSLSCLAENALVTFNGQSSPGGGPTQGTIPGNTNNAASGPQRQQPKVVDGVAIEVVTVMVRRQVGQGFSTTLSGSVSFGTTLTPIPPTTTTTVTTTIFRSTSSSRATSRATSSATSSIRSSSTTSRPPSTSTTQRGTPPPPPVATAFPVTDEVLDFARVSVLFVLQQETLQNAETAQIAIQRFFTTAGQGSAAPSPVTLDQARNLTLGNGNSVNLVDFLVDVGSGPVGRGPAPARALRIRDMEPAPDSSPDGSGPRPPSRLLRMFHR